VELVQAFPASENRHHAYQSAPSEDKTRQTEAWSADCDRLLALTLIIGKHHDECGCSCCFCHHRSNGDRRERQMAGPLFIQEKEENIFSLVVTEKQLRIFLVCEKVLSRQMIGSIKR
jgi:hypothetical protein